MNSTELKSGVLSHKIQRAQDRLKGDLLVLLLTYAGVFLFGLWTSTGLGFGSYAFFLVLGLCSLVNMLWKVLAFQREIVELMETKTPNQAVQLSDHSADAATAS